MSVQKYKGNLAVVTGASSGIGYELANVFAENGFNLIVISEENEIVEAAKHFEAHGVIATPVVADLATYEGVEKALFAIKSADAPVHSLALNAGVGVGGEFIATSLESELSMIQLNIVSLVHMTKKILPDMLTRNEGKILFTSSIAAEMPGPYYAVYAATKSFVQSFSEALREELKDTNITITALQPGATDTNFFSRANMLDTPAGKAKKDSPRDVAIDGFEALMDDKDHVVAGSFSNKIRTTMARIIPETTQAKLHGKDTKPESLN